jgi:hypothetical protein
MKTKSILACFLTGLLIAGFAFYPFVPGNPQSAKAFNTDVIPGGKTKQVTLIANEGVVQVAPDNALHPGGVSYNAYTFNGTIPLRVLSLIIIESIGISPSLLCWLTML